MECCFKKPYANVRLFCFPGAGGGPAFYTHWGRELTENIEVYTICLPGRGPRGEEPFCSTKKETLEWIVDTLKKDFWDKPFAFFGHSMGSILCFWVALELKRLHNREPVHMFLSGAQPPHSTGFKNILRLSMSFEEFMEQASSELLDRLPKDMTQNKDMMNLFLPIWKADVVLLRKLSYEHKPDQKPPLTCSFDLFCGHEEHEEVINYLDDWNELTRGTVSKYFMPGNHYFLNDKENTKKVHFHIEMKLEEVA